MKYFLGLDNGGTTTKAALYLCDGTEIGTVSKHNNILTPKLGFSECDMEEMWQSNCEVIHNLLLKTKIDAANIAGIAVCGHGKGLYLWGKDGRPLRNGIISTDNRAWQYPLRWKKDGIEDKVFELSNQHILACQPVTLLAWIQDNEPDLLDNLMWIFECKDYIRFRLTGEAYAELTDYSGTNFLNLKTRQYDDELLKIFGITNLKYALPPLCLSTDICGFITEETAMLTGLKAGTPVAGGMFDIDACAIALNVVDEQNICMIAGTWSINEYIRRSPVLDGSVLMNSLFCIPDYFLVEECSPTSAGNYEWFSRTLLPELNEQSKLAGKNIYEVIDAWIEDIPSDEFCPIFLPFLMASNVHPNAKGCFLGMSSFHKRAHMIRSVYEGVAFSHRYHLNKLLSSRNVMPYRIRLAGGVARSRVWTQIFADVLQFPIEVVQINEAGTLGCAIAASVAVRQYDNIIDAANSMCKINAPVFPKPMNTEAYTQKYNLYLQAIDALDGIWDSMQNYMEIAQHKLASAP